MPETECYFKLFLAMRVHAFYLNLALLYKFHSRQYIGRFKIDFLWAQYDAVLVWANEQMVKKTLTCCAAKGFLTTIKEDRLKTMLFNKNISCCPRIYFLRFRSSDSDASM